MIIVLILKLDVISQFCAGKRREVLISGSQLVTH
jgi:hypothetical protein